MLEVIIYIADAILFFILTGMGRQLYRALRTLKAPQYDSELSSESELPSVTVCIPARNEQHALMDCLTRVLASTYQKLEIIVLDDVSGDDTSVLIKSFASEGVRFVKGKKLPVGWLGKNHALQGLLSEASGTYILFLDVDTVLAPQAIENMVQYALLNKNTMVSVLPRREDGWRASVIASPLRYFWELIFHRASAPAVASSAWLIHRETLQDRFKGFTDFKSAVQPEAKIAAALAQNNEYQFLIGTKEFGVAYEKKWRSQLITSVRLLFPVLGGKVLLSVMAMLDLLIFLVPSVALVCAISFGIAQIALWLNVAMFVGYGVLYAVYAKHAWNKGWVFAFFIWPIIIAQEIILIFASLLQYKRSTVRWKGRLIRPGAQN